MDLYQAFQIPKVFESTDLTLWEDEYISSLLLNAHLNPHIDDASRNHEFINNSAQWILSRIKNHGSLLDLGCGPGLYTTIFSKSIDSVTGIDFSKRSIEYAKGTDPKSTYIKQNYLEFKPQSQYDTITMIHCELGSLSKSDRKHLLQTIKHALKEDGRFIFDIFSPQQLTKFQESKTWVNRKRGFFTDTTHTELIFNVIYPDNISLRQSIIIKEDEVKTYRQWYQYLDLASITQELEDVGLKVFSVHENLCGEEYTHFSSTLALEVSHL